MLTENQQEELALMVVHLGHNLDVNATDLFGRTPLLWAAKKGLYNFCLCILENMKVDINACTNGGETALFWAALEGRKAIVDLLLDFGADVTRKNNSGQTADQVAKDPEIQQKLRNALKKAMEEQEKQERNKMHGTEESPFVTKTPAKPQPGGKKLKITLKK